MNIAVFHNFPAGGGKRTIFEQVKGLIKLGHTLTVFELSNPDSKYCDVRSLPCSVITYPFELSSSLPSIFARAFSDFKNFTILPLIHYRIAKKINSSGFDVALVHTDKYTESPFILHFLRIPNVYHCHELLRIGYEPEYAFTEKVSLPKLIYELLTRKIRVWIDKINAQAAGVIITNTRFIQQKIKIAYDRTSKICYSGVDPSVFKPTKLKKPQILFMGQRNFVGGYEFVKSIFALLPKKYKVKLLIFGFPKGKPDTSNDEILSDAYSQSLATLCVSINEPFGLKAIESMSCGTPVLAVNQGGYAESVIHNKTGWLLPREPKQFVNKIIYLLSNPKVSVSMGHISREIVKKHWTWDRHVHQLEKILFNVSKS